jgi:hypothetical protein
MKLLIAASPKTGNVWLEKILAEVYDLPIVHLSGTSLEELPPISKKRFITHQHYLPRPDLLEWGEQEGVQFLTMMRHPGDLFVSLYHYVNNFAPLWEEKGWIGTSPAHVMIGKDIDSPEVLEFMKTKFRSVILSKSIAWLQSGKSVVARYEDLHSTPVETIRQVTDQIKPTALRRIERAVEATHINKMRQQSDLMRLHCRKGRVGGWQDELGEAHMAILREDCSCEMALLGYDLE